MMRLFRRYVLGGKSDKTEGTLFAFLLGVAWMTAIIVLEAMGIDMSKVIEPVAWYLAVTVGAFTGATVTHHLRPPAPPAEPGQDWQAGYPGGEWTPEADGRPAPPQSAGEVYPR